MGKPQVPAIDANALKQSIIDLARRQANEGAHYLWGGAGNRPGQSDGAVYRPSHVQLHPNLPDLAAATNGSRSGAPFVPTLFAAWVDSTDQGKLACAGRCGIPEVQKNDLALNMPIKEALNLKLKDLKPDQLEDLKKKSKSALQYRWPRPNGTLGVTSYPSTVWGECCIGVRHFDCIGLVNYCFSTILQKKWQYGVDHFASVAAATRLGFTQVTLGKARACDIVTIGKVHIGIVSAEGSAIEAREPMYGVQETDLGKRPWTLCFRPPDSEFRIGPGR